jgi:hypothetical protein
MNIWLMIGALLAVVAVGLPLSIWLTAPIRRNKQAFAIASALFFSFGVYNPSQDKIVDAREEDEHAKRQKAGDPPDNPPSP